MNKTLRRLLLDVQPPTQYLLGPFRFPTNEAAPLATPHVETEAADGLTVTDTTNVLSVASNKLTGAGFSAIMNPGVVSTVSFPRLHGLALLGTLRYTSGRPWVFGWSTSTTPTTTQWGARFAASAATAAILAAASTAVVVTLSEITTSVDYELAVVLRQAGAFYFVRGGAFTLWTLVWVEAANTNSPYYATWGAYSTAFAGTIDDMRAINLSVKDPRFGTATGIAEYVIDGAVAALSTYSHNANCLLDDVVTTRPSAGNMQVAFRMQDASNYWFWEVNSSGDFSLYEVVATVATQRGTAAAVLTSGHRVVIIADGTTIRGYSNNVLRWTYASASNFQTSTSGKVLDLGTGGALSTHRSWLRASATYLPNV